MDCTVTTTALDGATLVSVVVENPHEEPARFRLENDLDGPVFPPRRRGYPEPGWDEDGYEGVLAAGERRSLGYAVPVPPGARAARIAWTEPAESTDSAGERNPSTGRTEEGAPRTTRDQGVAEETARSFRDPRPPRTVLTPPGLDPTRSHSAGELP